MVVYIVGAGPGDPELLTLKAKRLIESAEVVIYDKLIGKEILNWVSPDCELIYMGKREKGSNTSQNIQQAINTLLLEHGRDKHVVRLKGGDPFIFGRGGEEARECSRQGIPFEIVPGISSCFAVPAYAGIPVSHRDHNSCFAVLTGHESDKDETAIEWERLPENIVVLMGVGKIKNTAKHLMEMGRSPSTQVAAIFKGTTPEQRTVVTTLERIAEEGIDLSPPVIFVIGPIVGLQDELSWFERKLERAREKTVVLTRAKGHFRESEELLESYGFETIPMPLIEIVSREFELPSLNGYDALAFTSLEGVKRVAEKTNLEKFEGRIFAIGPKTKEYLERECGINATIGERFNSEGLAEHILDNLTDECRVLALRSSAATGILGARLSERLNYTEVHVYDIKRLPADPEAIKKGDVVFVVSASCAKSLAELDPTVFEGKTIVSIGPETSRHLPIPHVKASDHTLKGMVEAYMDFLWSGLL